MPQFFGLIYLVDGFWHKNYNNKTEQTSLISSLCLFPHTKNIYSVLPVTDDQTLVNVHSGENNAPSFNVLFCGKEYHISSHEISLRY